MDTLTSLKKRQNSRADPALHPLEGMLTLRDVIDRQRQTIARLRNGLRLIAGEDPATRDLAERIIQDR